jgi:hypothetical protein
MGSVVRVCGHFDPLGSYSFWMGFSPDVLAVFIFCCDWLVPVSQVRRFFWLCFRLYFLVPDADVYAHVKRHQVLILYTWSPNLGVRKLAPATHPSLEPADSFGIGLLECDSPHILHFFAKSFRASFVWFCADTMYRLLARGQYGLTNEVNRVHWRTAYHGLFPLSN